VAPGWREVTISADRRVPPGVARGRSPAGRRSR